MLHTKGLLMPEARFRDAEGKTTIVQLPGTKLQSGAVYYEESKHKGHLICKCCEAPVHFHPGSRTISGDNLRGPRPHFVSNRQAYHSQDCTVDLAIDEGRDPREYDLTKGYRIHINTGELRQQFSGRARPYGRRSYPHQEILINNPDLKDREAYSAKSAENFQRLIGKKQHHRMRTAVIVNGGDVIDWKDFFIRYTHKQDEDKRYCRRQPRFLHLVDLLQQYGNNQLVMMEIDLTTPRYAKGKVICAEAHRIKDRQKDEAGYRKEIIPRVVVPPGPDQTTVAGKLAEKERFLVMGVVSMKTRKDPETKKIYHYLDIKVDNPDWVVKADLAHAAKLTNEKKQAAPQLALQF